ncbi:MAG TPA: ROK family protein [Pyrinomonadaceae bacterium]|nr:ROK family protein [Pyrinomonadaceae bacterium]
MKKVVAGIDIGGTNISIAVAETGGEVVSKRQLPTQSSLGPFSAFDKMSEAIEKMLAEEPFDLEAVGVGSPSPIDVRKGLIMSPSNLLEWAEFPIVDLLNDRFGVPVKLENDANAAAVGEYIYGAGRGYRNIFYLTVSTGIGGGIIIDGNLYHGISTAAGEIGHTIIQPDGIRCNCGSRGCLETICAGVHIARRARERLENGEASILSGMVSDIDSITARTVVDAVQQGDPLATAIWDETCHFLAIGIANVITLVAPEIVIVGGGVAAAGDLLFVQLRKRVPHFVSMVPADKINIVPARLGTESGLYGAVAIARELISPNSRSIYAT